MESTLAVVTSTNSPISARLYLELLKDVLTRLAFTGSGQEAILEEVRDSGRKRRWIVQPLQAVLAGKNLWSLGLFQPSIEDKGGAGQFSRKP